MTDWRPEHDVELNEMFNGMDGRENYAKALVTSAMVRLGERVVARYVEGKPLDETLVAIERIEPETPPAPPKQSGLGKFADEYKAFLEQAFRAQFSGPELDGLLKTLNEAS